jgi:hypothetical protein
MQALKDCAPHMLPISDYAGLTLKEVCRSTERLLEHERDLKSHHEDNCDRHPSGE